MQSWFADLHKEKQLCHYSQCYTWALGFQQRRLVVKLVDYPTSLCKPYDMVDIVLFTCLYRRVRTGLITSPDPLLSNLIYCREIFLPPESGFSSEEQTTCCEMKQAAKLNRLSFALVAILLIYCFSLMVSWRVRGQQTLKNVQMQQKVHESSSHEAASLKLIRLFKKWGVKPDNLSTIWT